VDGRRDADVLHAVFPATFVDHGSDLTPVDGFFSFNTSAPLTAGTSGLGTAIVKRVFLGRPVARSAARGRKGH
jgi:hypothetical protein